MKRNLPETDTNGALPEQFREHPAAQKKTDVLLDLIRDGRPMTLRQQLCLTVELSVPAIIAQLSSIIMQYIDAAMVGRTGAKASASIGLVSTTTWLFWGLCKAAATGFSVQVAHRIGAGDLKGARMILLQSLVGTLVFSLLLVVLGAGISSSLPAWLGGDVSIRRDASIYFFIFSIFLPVLQMIFLAGGMLRCSGNMRIPSLLGVIMCVMGILMYLFAPQIIGMMTPVEEIRQLGVMALRIEAFAEPMFAASIVSYGVFVGAADTLIPCLMNLFSIWVVRLTLAAWLAPTLGLQGVWIAMCVELCFRGFIFLVRLKRGRWLKCDKT